MTSAAVSTDPTALFDMKAAPLRIGRVGLRVRDLATVADFYRKMLGLQTVEQGVGRVTLGAGGVPLLELEGDARLAPLDRRQAGLFHTAFLMPSRGDLGRWLGHVAQSGIRLEGASDHIVSEAIYLSDPEGNGIEVYADRPEAQWRRPDGTVKMGTLQLDLNDVYAAGGGGPYLAAPKGLIVGHVHLQVGDTRTADGFWRDALGFDVAADYPGASFYGSGGYHHQLAGNVWNSRGAKMRPAAMAGLARLEIVARDLATAQAVLARAEAAGLEPRMQDGAAALIDPWGSTVSLTA